VWRNEKLNVLLLGGVCTTVNKELKITLIRSGIGRPKKHRLTLKSLGLNKLHKTVVTKDTPQVRGMINKVSHLLKVSE
jgi:large subunit ribosomal protein L30